jgi:uncharacterized membrane protein
MLVAVGILALVVLAGGLLLWPRGDVARPASAGQQNAARLVKATLTRIQTVSCEAPDPAAPLATCIKVQARLADGGRQVAFETTDPTGDTYRVGQRVTLTEQQQEGQPTYYNISDLERTRPMLALAALFVLAVIAFGRWQGVRSLIGLAVSFAVILGFVIPAILRGRSPTTVALVGAMAIMLASLYLSHGVGRKTTAATVGTAFALLLTAALSAGFVAATALTGLTSEDARGASFQVGGLSLRGLLLAGIIIGGLGVLDDVTVSQASLVFELRRADPAAGFGELVHSALSVGRDVVAATVNTLFLAYAGASLPLLVLFVVGGEALGSVATAEVVAVEVVRTLCGSVGLIAAVPFTTLLAAALAPQQVPAHDIGQPSPATAPEPTGPEADPDAAHAYSPARGLDPEEARALFQRVLDLHQSRQSHATVGSALGDWLSRAELPADARQAATELERLAAADRRSAPWYRRSLPSGITRLDLRDPDQLRLLRRYGPFSADTRIWVEDDPDPAVETAEALDGHLRVTYRLTADQLDQLDALLAEAGWTMPAWCPSAHGPAQRAADRPADVVWCSDGPDELSARTSSIRWVSGNLQGQRHGVTLTTRSGPPRAWSTGSGRSAWRGPNRWGRAPGRKSQTSARPPGRSTRPSSASPAVGSAQWCIDRVLTTRSNDSSGNASAPTSPTRKDGRRSASSPARSALARARAIMAGSRSSPVTSRPCWPASRIDRWPGPQPTSSTWAPAGVAAATSAAIRPTNGPSSSRLRVS